MTFSRNDGSTRRRPADFRFSRLGKNYNIMEKSQPTAMNNAKCFRWFFPRLENLCAVVVNTRVFADMPTGAAAETVFFFF